MGGKKSTTTQNVTIPAEVMARYTAVNKQAAETAQRPFQKYGTTAADFVAQINPQQTAGIDAVNAASGSYRPLMAEGASATQAGMGPAYAGIENYMSPYIKNVADTTGALMRQQQEQAQSGALGTAAMSGAFGGDRAGIAAANLQQQNQMGYGKTMADIMNQGYTQALGASQADLARQLQGGAQLAGIGAQTQQLGLQGAEAQLQAGGLQQQTEQAGKTALVNQFMQEQGYPFQVAQFLANIAMGTGALSGSTTTTQQPTSFFANGGSVKQSQGGGVSRSDAGMGYADGGGVAGPYGAAVGSQPWMEGYIPQAYLPVGELMMSDPSLAEQSSQNTSDYINQMLEMGKSIKGLTERRAYGGGVDAPNTARSYLSDVIDSQNKEDKPELVRASSPDGQEGGGLGNALGNVVKIMGMFSDGGVVGRGGYADGGGPAGPGPAFEGAGRTRFETTPVGSGPAFGDTGRTRSGLAPMTSIAPQARPTFAPDASPRPQARPGLAPETSMRPQVRTDGEGLALAADTKAAIGQPPVGGMAPAVTTPRMDTGVAPKGGYEPIVPLGTQLQFVSHELQKPEYSSYMKQSYNSPSDAAVAFEGIYERAGGAGNDRAASNAEDIYAAAQSGDMSGLPPNVVTAYNHFVQTGMDPIKAAGATGRLMVESYAHLDPNARNTLGGGMGTYGVAQWRGDRIKELADFAGVPVDSIAGAPSSTPEGRYYSGLGGGDNTQVATGGLGGADMGAPETGGKAYEDRNRLGRLMYDPKTNKLSDDALLSILSGIGTMASSPSRFLGSAILQGVGAGAGTLASLRQQAPERAAKQLENMRQVAMDTMQWNELNGTNLTPSQYAAANNISIQIPEDATAKDILTSVPPTGAGEKLGYSEFQTGSVDIGGRQVPMQNDPASMQKFILDNSWASPETPIGRAVERTRSQLDAINASGGVTVDAGGQQFQIPGYTEVGDVQAQSGANREAAAAFRALAPEEINSASRQLAAIKTLESVYEKMEPGKFANVGAEASATLSALDPGNVMGWQSYDLTDPAQYEIAMKGAGEIMAARLQTLPGGAPAAEIDFLSSVTPTPNMQPESVKKLLAITKAEAKYRMDMYNSYDPSVHGNDINAYVKSFADGGNTFTKYVDDAMASMPRFAGEGIEQGSAEAELVKRGYIKKPDGTWGKP